MTTISLGNIKARDLNLEQWDAICLKQIGRTVPIVKNPTRRSHYLTRKELRALGFEVAASHNIGEL